MFWAACTFSPCTLVPLVPCTLGALYPCTLVPLYPCTLVPLVPCTLGATSCEHELMALCQPMNPGA